MVSWPILRSSSAMRPGIVERRQIGAAPSNAGKGQFSFGAPLSAPAFQQFRAQLVFPRNFTGGRTGVQGAHGGDLQIATVNSSGQIHSSLRVLGINGTENRVKVTRVVQIQP